FNVTILFSRRSENRKIPYVVVDFNAAYKTNFSACSLPKRNFLFLARRNKIPIEVMDVIQLVERAVKV
ncbi:MAG: hypothetical protein QGH96_01270, partial [Desulfobacterales bacterium]|nr:hypothetical protein [Desulfobacterales bacterium]